MNALEQARADLRDADAALANYVSIEDLEERVRVAQEAVLKAARAPGAASAEMLNELEAEDAAAADFPEDESETDEPLEASEDADEDPVEDIFATEDDDPYLLADSNVGPVDSATMTDVVEAVTEAAETIDATDEVSVDEAVDAGKPNGLAHLGENYTQA